MNYQLKYTFNLNNYKSVFFWLAEAHSYLSVAVHLTHLISQSVQIDLVLSLEWPGTPDGTFPKSFPHVSIC